MAKAKEKTKKVSLGTCNFCEEKIEKSQMTRHLKACEARKEEIEAVDSSNAEKVRLFHLLIEGQYNPEYWLHLELPASMLLRDLDMFLRFIWVECCSHMSDFTIDGTTYEDEIPGLEFVMLEGGAGGDVDEGEDEQEGDHTLEVQLGQVLQIGQNFHYQYDFGSTTHIALKLLEEREGALMLGQEEEPVELVVMARNEPPVIPCRTCGKPATKIIPGYYTAAEGAVCDKCAKKQGEEDEFLPVVNSPRVGVCAYTGGAFDEYVYEDEEDSEE